MDGKEKKVSRTKNASRNIMWGVLKSIVSCVLPFITRTVMIYTLGMDYVGLGSLFSSILQVLSFAELGIGSALVFSMYEPMANDDKEKISALLNLYKKLYKIIGSIILVIGLMIMPFLENLISGDVPNDINLQILFFIYLCNNTVGYFLYTYKQSLFVASQRNDMLSKVGVVLQLSSSILQILILLTIRNYYIYVAVFPVITVITNVVIARLVDKSFPEIICEGDISVSEKKEIETKVRGLFFQKIGNIVLTSVDTIVISSFLGLHILGIYNGYYYVITMLFSFISVIQQALIPSIGNSIVSETRDKNLGDFKKFHLMYMWIVIWWSACLMGLYQPFIRLWQGKENMLSNEVVALIVIYFFVYKQGDIIWIYREAIGLWYEDRFAPFVSAVLNLVINIILVNSIGVAGVLISTIVSLIFIYTPWCSKGLFCRYFKSQKEWGRFLIRLIYYFVSMLIVVWGTWECCSIVSENGIFNLLIRGIMCVIIPNALLVILNMKNPDFKQAGKFMLTVVPKKIVPGFIVKYFG